MSNSNLVSYIDTTSSNWNHRAGKISRITIHHAAMVINDLTGFSAILRTGRKCSWNYAIDNNGNIGLFVEEQYRAWTSNSEENDDIAVTIEVSNSTTAPNWLVSDKAYLALLNLCEDICRRNDFRLKYSGRLAGSNLTMHQWFYDTPCPGPYLASKFSAITKTVNERLKANTALDLVQDPNVPNTSYDAVYTGDSKSNQALINVKALTPYVVTINRDTKSPDYKKLKEFGVVAVIVEGGRLYDVTHSKVKYRNPNLAKQVAEIEKNGLHYGMYVDVYARSVAEADAELYQLRSLLRKFIPVLGIWLRLHFTTPQVVNDSILSKYITSLIEWGWDGKIGIYATPDQISKISWKSKWCNYTFLWLDNHLKSLDSLNELLTPSFFSV